MKKIMTLSTLLMLVACASTGTNKVPGTVDQVTEAPKQNGKYIIAENNKNLKKLQKYKWWLQYETPDVILLEFLDNKQFLNNDNPRVAEMFTIVEPAIEKRSMCFIEMNNRTYFEMTYYDTSIPRDQNFIKEETSICVKRNLSYYTLNTFSNKSFTITDHNLAKVMASIDKNRNKCMFQRYYFFDSWKYKMAKTPKLKKNQALLTIIEKTGDCASAKVEYYIGEMLSGPTVSKDVIL